MIKLTQQYWIPVIYVIVIVIAILYKKEPHMATWSNIQVEETRKAFTDINKSELNNFANVCLKNADGRFGVIFREDIDNNNWWVMDSFTDNKTYQYNSLKQMLDNGWIVD